MAGDSKDIAEVDQFLAAPKTLIGGHPQWGPSVRQGEFAATWGIRDELGIPRGSLRFKCRAAGALPTVNLLLRKMLISRVDVVPDHVCENQVPWGAALGLEPRVCGPHIHPWDMNRAWVLENGLNTGMPAKVALPGVVALSQAVNHLCYTYNITRTPDQEGFETKPAESLFEVIS